MLYHFKITYYVFVTKIYIRTSCIKTNQSELGNSICVSDRCSFRIIWKLSYVLDGKVLSNEINTYGSCFLFILLLCPILMALFFSYHYCTSQSRSDNRKWVLFTKGTLFPQISVRKTPLICFSWCYTNQQN